MAVVSVILHLGVVAVGSYVLLLVYVYGTQSRRLYQPHREITTTPAAHGYAYESVTLHAADGVRLHGWFVPHGESRRVLLLCHGNARNIADCVASIAIFHALGFGVFVFDYRGYGRSEGRPTEHGTYRDAEAAWRYLTQERGLAPAEIVVLGRSLGAAIAAWLAARHTPAALVIESTFTSLPDLAAELHPLLPSRILTRYRYPVRAQLARMRCPVLIVHSREDELIPFHHGQALYESAREPKALLAIDGLHYDGYFTTGRRYEEGLARFFARYLGAGTGDVKREA